MIFNMLLPVDSDPAMDIDIYIRDLKESVAERLQCTNSDGVDEHQEGDDLGIHEPSLVSYVAAFATLADYNAASKTLDGLYYIRETNSLYSSTGPLSTPSHDELLDRDNVDAHDFYHVGDDSRVHTVNMEFTGAPTVIQDDPLIEEGSPLTDSHMASTWRTAHGDNSFDSAWIQPTVLSGIPLDTDNLVSGVRYTSLTEWNHMVTAMHMKGLYVYAPRLMPVCRFRNHTGLAGSGGTLLGIDVLNFTGYSDVIVHNTGLSGGLTSVRMLVLRQ